MPTFGSLYTGLGGFDCGLVKAGYRCRWQAETDADLRAHLARRFPDARQHESAAAARSDEIADVDLVYAEIPLGSFGPEWAMPAVEVALTRASWLLLDGSPAPWLEIGAPSVQLIAHGWRVSYRYIVYATDGPTGRSLVRKRVWMLASRTGHPSAVMDLLHLDPDEPDGRPQPVPGVVGETDAAALADVEAIRMLPSGWTDGLPEADARDGLAGAASPAVGYAFGLVLKEIGGCVRAA